jgi:hypothetical protein
LFLVNGGMLDDAINAFVRCTLDICMVVNAVSKNVWDWSSAAAATQLVGRQQQRCPHALLQPVQRRTVRVTCRASDLHSVQ